MLSAENGCFPRNRRIARAMNPLFPIRADAEFPDGLKALDNPDQVLLAWRFRPFPQPREWRSILFVSRPRSTLPVLRSSCVPTPRRGSCAPASGRERGRPGRCVPILSRQAIRCRAFADGQSGRRQLRRPYRSRSLRRKPLSQSLDNFTLKRTNAKIVLQFAEMFPTRFVPLRISGERLCFAPDLRGDEVEHVWRRDFLRAKNATRKSQIGKMDGKPQSVCVSTSPPNQRSCPRKKMCNAGRSPQSRGVNCGGTLPVSRRPRHASLTDWNCDGF